MSGTEEILDQIDDAIGDLADAMRCNAPAEVRQRGTASARVAPTWLRPALPPSGGRHLADCPSQRPPVVAIDPADSADPPSMTVTFTICEGCADDPHPEHRRHRHSEGQ